MSLFSGTEHALPQWLPDETLFSWASRYHRLAGHRLAAQTCFALFGDRRHGSQHDLPTRLGWLADQTAGQLGTPEDVALNHTLLRYYLVPRRFDEVAAAISSLVEPTAGVLKFRLGILTSRFRANHPLKACPGCVDAHRFTCGSPYWHLAHQYPGVWMCLQHDTPLQVSTVKANGVGRFGWVLPPDAGLIDVVPATSVAALRRLADLIAGWSALAPGSLTPSGIAAACRLQLTRRDAWKVRASRADAGADFVGAIAELRQVLELQGLPASPGQGKSDIDRWVFAPRGGTHPLRHLAIVYWLFPRWDDFLAAYAEAQAMDQLADQGQLRSEPADIRRVEFVRALTAGKSVTASSKLVGVTVGTGLAWAAQHGFKTGRRPKSITESLQKCIAVALGRGDEKFDIAKLNRVSVQAVTRVLRSEVGLAEQRRLAQRERAQLKARQSWVAAQDALPGATVADLRAHAGAAYAWLRRHDKVWLEGHLPSARRPSTALRVDWDRRDMELAAAVRRIAAELAAVSTSASLRPWQIYQALPELKAKQSALARLPLTVRALDEVTRRAGKGSRQTLL
jgi:hypothetical protein